MLYRFFRSLLFLLPAESSHGLSLWCLKKYYSCSWIINKKRATMPSHPCSKMGMDFVNPVGLAGGFDKNADYIDALFAMGFGFIELGTVTPKPQPGNPKPRLFRISNKQALINRMGFNNKGVDYLVARLQQRKVAGVIGVNIGKNKSTSLSKAYQDYQICLEKVYAYADYVVINISSPNTPGLRELHNERYLDELLCHIATTGQAMATQHNKRVPVLLKISIDVVDDQLPFIVSMVKKYDLAGLVTSNTTVDKRAVSQQRYGHEAGGLSGAPLTRAANQQVKQLRTLLGSEYLLIGLGGIMSVTDAKRRLASGADLIQVYTGLIYNGPGWIKRMVQFLQH